MGEVIPLFDKEATYKGHCLRCDEEWTVTKEQMDVALEFGILYSPCCEQPSTVSKMRVKRDQKSL
jgi:hypothetical protein